MSEIYEELVCLEIERDTANKRITELEQAGHATLLREAEKDKRITELEEISGKWEDRYFAALDNVKQLQAENERWTLECRELHRTIAKIHEEYRSEVKDAERYRWGLKHPGRMAKAFIQWGSKYTDYNHRHSGVHPNEYIDTTMDGE